MNDEIIIGILSLSDSKTYAVLKTCLSQYAKYLADIAADIYDSCIKLYYAKYDPTIYDRHGDVSGFNLYSANTITSNDLEIYGGFDEYQLLPYEDRKSDIRGRVLDSVMDGIRGGGARKSVWKGWPQDWTAYYPNEYSQYDEWDSRCSTINDILDDFMENGVGDTQDYFYDLLAQHI